MRINIVSIDAQDFRPSVELEVDGETDVGVLKGLIEVELNIPFQSQLLTINEVESDAIGVDRCTLSELGVVEGDAILCYDKRLNSGVDNLGDGITRDHQRVDGSSSLSGSRGQGALAEALKNQDLRGILEQLKGRISGGAADRSNIRRGGFPEHGLLDPLSMEGQAMLFERLKQEQINQNYLQANEIMPEAFGQVIMLYVKVEINGHEVKAFVDSGAQTTIMSLKCAQRCEIERLIDTRFTGIAKGVGMAKVTGRIHMAQMKCKDVFITASFTILEDQPMDVLLGLDLLRRHQCKIDLELNCLHVGDEKLEFLSEHELREDVNIKSTIGDM